VAALVVGLVGLVPPAHAAEPAQGPGLTDGSVVSDGVVLSDGMASSDGSSGAAAVAASPRLTQKLYLDPDTQAAAAVDAARAAGRTSVAKRLSLISTVPQARWFGDWTTVGTTRSEVAGYVRAARAKSQTPVLVLYAIPGRDCGLYSAGGFTEKTYPRWITQVAKGLTDGAVRGSSRALVVLEPDALMLDCDDDAADARRDRLIRNATKELAATGAWVYLEAGNARWRTPADTAKRLRAGGIAYARGFATNISNFGFTTSEKAYAAKVAARLAAAGVSASHRHYVIDTSRNGRGPMADGEWCNPPKRGLGAHPRTFTSGGALDALLWIKLPGESDGPCHGAPGAGQWWEAGALELVKYRRT